MYICSLHSAGKSVPLPPPLPPPGSYYEYAGQRVLVPEWPAKYVTNNEVLNRNLAHLIRKALTDEKPLGIPEIGGRGPNHGGLSEWGKEVMLRVKAKIQALEKTDRVVYTEVRQVAHYMCFMRGPQKQTMRIVRIMPCASCRCGS